MPKTNHPIEAAEVMAYLDGELRAERAMVAAEHLENCDECQRIAADVKAVSGSLRSWQVEVEEPVVGPVLSAALAERVIKRRGFHVPLWIPALGSAAGVMVLLMWALLRPSEPPQRQGTIEIATPRHSLAIVPQGSSVMEVDEARTRSPLVARTSTLVLTSSRFDYARSGLSTLLERYHGYMSNLNIDGTGRTQTLTAVIRVPAVNLTAAMDDLRKLGHVESEHLEAQEVGGQVVDLDTRIANSRNTETRLNGILRDRTGKLSDVLEVERELDRVRGEIEAMESQRKGLNNRVEDATINLTITEIRKADSKLGRIGNGLAEGYSGMVDGVVAVAQVVATVGPSVLLWAAVLFFPVRFGWRRWRRTV